LPCLGQERAGEGDEGGDLGLFSGEKGGEVCRGSKSSEFLKGYLGERGEGDIHRYPEEIIHGGRREMGLAA
jgi:hypothetical protein